MSKERRKALVAEYRERPARPGVFAVRCTATGQVWTQSAPNLDNRRNGVWFALRLGTHPNRALQAAWTAHGEAAFSFEVLEAIEADDLSSYELANRLKEREAAWRAELGAGKVTG